MNRVHPYHSSCIKRVFDICVSLLGIIVLSPVMILITFLLLIINHGPVLFVQKRCGMGGKPFEMIKFRTMVVGAHTKQKKLKNLNEADGPVFKIYNDPRFTKFGKILAHTGLDELPQLINILRGDMSLVGPRPLPVAEAKKIPVKYKLRERIKPGAMCLWVIKGSHKLSFNKWMELDKDYVLSASLGTDISIILKTVALIAKSLLKIRITQP